MQKKCFYLFFYLFLVLLISSCSQNDNNKKSQTAFLVKESDIVPFLGADYFEPFEYGDLIICRRSNDGSRYDRYFEVIGFSESGKNKSVVIIPQHINGVPVFSTGLINNFSLEDYSEEELYEMCDLYPNLLNLPYKVNLQFNAMRYDYTINKYGGWSSRCFEYYDKTNLCFETYCDNIDNYKVYYGSCMINGTKGDMNLVRHILYDENNNKRNIGTFWMIMENNSYGFPFNNDLFDFTNENDDYINEFCENVIVVCYLEVLEKKYELYNHYNEKNNVESLTFDEWMNLNYRIKAANIEFRYNLKIDDTYYTNLSFSKNYNIDSLREDYYWIDYVANDKIMEPPDPYVEGYRFLGWYEDEECINLWDFDTIISEPKNGEYLSKTLYAKWEKIGS